MFATTFRRFLSQMCVAVSSGVLAVLLTSWLESTAGYGDERIKSYAAGQWSVRGHLGAKTIPLRQNHVRNDAIATLGAPVE
jgi:hypothetical protein